MTSSTSLPPGDYGLPLIGETLDFFRDPDYAAKKHRQYGAVFKTRLLGKPTVFVRGVEANRFVLTHDSQFAVSWPPSTKALLGQLSLALQTGDIHQNRRKLLAQAFMPRALSGYIQAIEQITQDYLERWAVQSDTQGELVWYPELRHYTLDVACKLLAGLDSGSQTQARPSVRDLVRRVIFDSAGAALDKIWAGEALSDSAGAGARADYPRQTSSSPAPLPIR